MKSFKQHIVEFDNPQIYCDMDGVLCDFEKAVVDAINRELRSGNPKNPKEIQGKSKENPKEIQMKSIGNPWEMHV